MGGGDEITGLENGGGNIKRERIPFLFSPPPGGPPVKASTSLCSLDQWPSAVWGGKWLWEMIELWFFSANMDRNKPNWATMRPDCVFACIDFGDKHLTYMERQMDGRTDNGWFQHRSTKLKTHKKQESDGKKIEHEHTSVSRLLSCSFITSSSPWKPFEALWWWYA